jgi:hypothetical protein
VAGEQCDAIPWRSIVDGSSLGGLEDLVHKAINGYVHRRTDGWISLRYRQGIVRQRPSILANLFGQ